MEMIAFFRCPLRSSYAILTLDPLRHHSDSGSALSQFQNIGRSKKLILTVWKVSMENKTCSYCGFIAQQSAEFCVSCGRELPASVAEARKSFEAPENQLYSIQPFTGIGAVINPTLRIFTKNFWFI